MREDNIRRNNAFFLELNIENLAANKKNKQITTTQVFKKNAERRVKVSKQSVIEDKSNYSSDDSEIEDVGWDYRTLTDVQQQNLTLSVKEKVGKLFIDR